MGKALYRTHRSRSFDEVVGQDHIVSVLQNAVKAGRFAHAYLLTGPRGTGKTSIARILAHAINELPYDDESPHLDIIEIDAASNRRIDDIRELRDKVHTAPVSARYKVYIIDEVHMLTGESFNALLKTLEEPPEHVIFILATTELHKLPPTIISRTQRFGLRLIDAATMQAHLRHIAEQEGIQIDDEALALIAEHGEGTFRDSISLLDQLASLSNKKITAEMVEQTLGLAPAKQLSELSEAITKKQSNQVRDALATFESMGIPATQLARQLIRVLQTEATTHPELYQLIDQLIDVPKSFDPRLKLLTTILLHVIEGRTDTSVATTVAALPSVSIALPKKPNEQKITQPKHSKSQPAPEPAAPTTGGGQLTDAQWQQVLDHIKNHSAPLYSVLSRASAQLSKDGHVLTLTCRFALHARKLDDAKQRASINSVIHQLFGIGIDIVVTTDPTLPSTSPASQEPLAGSQTAAVIAMMGGGEVVKAS